MSSAQRRRHTGVIHRLLAQPQRFGFFQAVRMLELHLRRKGKGANDKGGNDLISRRIRFGASLSNNFPASEIERLDVSRTQSDEHPSADDASGVDFDSVSLTPAFFGLLGHQGALPAYYTERMTEQEVLARDPAPRRFLELFSNRATALFYLAWKKYRLPLHYESGRHDTFMPMLLTLAGHGPGSLHEPGASKQGLPEEVAAHYAGLLRHRPVSATQMQTILTNYFGVAIRVEQFVGHWYAVPDAQRTRLGGEQAKLGATALCGGRVWQHNLRIRLWIGPLDRSNYEQFLPQGSARLALSQWLQMLAGFSLEYEIRPVLRSGAVTGMQLSSGSAARLGWDAFMCTRPNQHDRRDVAYTLKAAH